MRFTKLLLILLMPATIWASSPAEPLQLQPNMDQRVTSNLAVKLLTNWHYKDTRLDDELSSRILDS